MKNIGEVIKQYRLEKNMTQEELGRLMFVSKQAVSKWENGKTLPDINTIRKLAEILSIPHDEILGESIRQTKTYKKWISLLIPVVIISIMTSAFLYFAGGHRAISRWMQSGVGLVTVYRNGELLQDGGYKIEGLSRLRSGGNGYTFDIGYGDVKGTITTEKGEEIIFGFVNTNEWHNVQITVCIDDADGKRTVSQNITYKTDDNKVVVHRSSSEPDDVGKANVYLPGV